jgi:chloramphenicol-sensitive protein RarD
LNASKEESQLTGSGTLYALGAYTLWGVFPVYWKFLKAFSSLELIAHRLIWAFLFYLCLSAYHSRGNFATWLNIYRSPKLRLAVIAASVFLTTNWLLYIYAVNSGQVVEASLGYFITPLFNVLTGWLVLRETLSRTRWISLALAAVGVSLLAFQSDHFPWIALGLATTFSIYGLIRKRLTVSVFDASTAETAALVIPATAFVIYSRYFAPEIHQASTLEFSLLAASGVVTGLPLIWFAQAARRLPLSKLGFFQYIAPTIQFLLGVFAYSEPFSTVKLWSFAFIWAALGVFSWETLRKKPLYPSP